MENSTISMVRLWCWLIFASFCYVLLSRVETNLLPFETHYNAVGECDLAFLSAPDFEDGLGLFIYIRTKARYEFSFIGKNEGLRSFLHCVAYKNWHDTHTLLTWI